MKKNSLNRKLIFLSALLIMFLPRRIYIAGVFSFRAVILLILILYVAKYKKIRFPKQIATPLVLIYFIYAFLNYIFTFQLASGIGFLVDSVIFICLITSLIRDRESLNYFIDVFILMLTAYSVLGIIESFTGVNIYDIIARTSAVQGVRFGLTRFCGAGLVSSNNANFLLLASILVMYRIINCDSKKYKNKLIVVYILNTFVLFLTLTRATILLFLCLQLIWLLKAGALRFFEKHFKAIVPTLAALVVLIVFVPQINTLVSNFVGMFLALFDTATAESISISFGSNAEGTGQRLQLYKWVAEQIKGHELFGKGANTAFIQEYTTWYGKRVTKNSLENHYLMMYYQLGIVGLVTFLGHYMYMLYYTLKHSLTYKKKRNTIDFPKWNLPTMVAWGLIVMLPTMFSTGLFDELRMIYLLFALTISYNSFTRIEG